MEQLEMLMNDAIDLSWSPEADSKVNEVDLIVPQTSKKFRRHTVVERRKWDAKAKAYALPKCGIRHSLIRELNAKGIPISGETYSELQANKDLHNFRAYNMWAREEAMRDRYPKSCIDIILEDYEEEKKDDAVNEESDAFWKELECMVDDGQVYFSPDGGLYINSPEAFSFLCMHQDEILKIIS